MPVRQIAALLCLLAAVGCATIDYDYPRQPAYVVTDTTDTRLGLAVAPSAASHPQSHAGFAPLNDGVDALAARLVLARNAERSIDVQYYLIKNDIVGRVFIAALLEAADRGVRVRLLLDDMFTAGHDIGLAALDSHPNFAIRVFNPFYRGTGGRARSAATGFGRINRRMHNKSFTVDNQVTVVGGRNIAAEYFGAREDAKFGDLDVMGIGPVVQEVSDMFDTYWNHETALPVPAIVKELDDPEGALTKLRTQLATAMDDLRDSKYAAAVRVKYLDYLQPGKKLFDWSPFELVVDSPDKGVKRKAQEADSIVTPLVQSIRSAERELIIVSPYFVPTQSGVDGLAALERRGVEVTVITNSLAANNQLAVHGGYAAARKPLLAAGVDIYEARPDADVAGTEFVDASGAKATLHTKAFMVDDREVFIGSFNFDPRSAYLNTELGIIIRNAELAARYGLLIEQALSTQTFEVLLNDDGDLSWRGYRDGAEIIYTKEPETTWVQRTMAWFARIIPKSQL
ncbi:MAG: phospholipase D family protein [Gammaproteobacteria bacterium]|nr:phospholipase D family protein [Gammaproteobacteria bacterium]